MFEDKNPPSVLLSVGVSDDVIRYNCEANKNNRESLKEVIDLLELTEEKTFVEISCEAQHNAKKEFEEYIKPALDENNWLDQIESIFIEHVFDIAPVFWHGVPPEDLKPTMTIKIRLKNGDAIIVNSSDFKYEKKEIYKADALI